MRRVISARTSVGIQPSIKTASISIRVAADRAADARPSAAPSIQSDKICSLTCQ